MKEQKLNKCECCGEIIQRKEGEPNSYYNKRKTCSKNCRNKLISQKRIKDLSNIRFGKLQVIKMSNAQTKHKNTIWECICDCGNVTNVAGGDLQKKYGGTKSCGQCSNNDFKLHQDGYWVGKDLKGKIFYFDIEDYEKVSKHTWYENYGYFWSTINKQKIALHRFILNLQDYDISITVDHINKLKYDNRKINLRICHLQNNMWNKDKYEDKIYTSKYIGVHWHKHENNWQVNIRNEKGKQVYLGSYTDEIKAAQAYDDACYKIHKEYSVLNFPERYGL